MRPHFPFFSSASIKKVNSFMCFFGSLVLNFRGLMSTSEGNRLWGPFYFYPWQRIHGAYTHLWSVIDDTRLRFVFAHINGFIQQFFVVNGSVGFYANWSWQNYFRLQKTRTNFKGYCSLWEGISLRGYCTSGPYFWRLCAFSQKIKQLRTKYPMDLVRNVPRNSKITVLLQ